MPFSPFVLSNKIIGTPFQQLQMPVTHTILDLDAIQPAKQERTGGSSAPHEALDAFVEHLVKQTEPEDVLRRLIVFADATLENRCLVELPIMVTHRLDGKRGSFHYHGFAAYAPWQVCRASADAHAYLIHTPASKCPPSSNCSLMRRLPPFPALGVRTQCYPKVSCAWHCPYPQDCLTMHRSAADSDECPPVPIHSWVT